MWFRHFLLSISCVFVPQVCGRGCSFDVVSTNKPKLPLLFHNHTTYFELAIPERGEVNLKANDRITLACPGNRNYLTATNSNSTSARCLSGRTLTIFRKRIDFDDLQCNKDIRGDVRKTTTSCAGGKGYITEIGYQVTKNDWFTLIKICYDDDTGLTLYTEHNLHGEKIKFSAKSTDRPGFSTEGLGPGIAASVAYTQAFQKSTFNRLLDSASLASHYINNRSYLARGHLAPSGDFLFATTKRTTFYLINTTPQWQVINGGNWKSVETSIRKTAEKYNRTFTIITGTHGVLILPDIKQIPKPIYLLSTNKLPVPREVWKIVYDSQNKEGIAIVVMNNPFVNNPVLDGLLCDNICNQYGWSTNNWVDASRGFTYCCDLEKFLNVVRIAPQLNVRGILRGSETDYF